MKKVVTNGAHTDPNSRRRIENISESEIDLLSRTILYSESTYMNLRDLEPTELIELIKSTQGFNGVEKAINPALEDAKEEITQKLSEADEMFLSEVKLLFAGRIEAMRLLFGKIEKAGKNNYVIDEISIPEFIHLINTLQEVMQQAFVITNSSNETLQDVAKNFGALPEDTKNKFGQRTLDWIYTEEECKLWRREDDKDVRATHMRKKAEKYMERLYAMLEILNDPYGGNPNEA